MFSNTEVIVVQIVMTSTSLHHYHCQRPIYRAYQFTKIFSKILWARRFLRLLEIMAPVLNTLSMPY